MSAVSRARARYRVASLLGAVVLVAGILPGVAVAVAPSAPPTLTSPADGTVVSANPTLAWTAVAGAVRYRVQVASDSLFTTIRYQVDTVNTKATPNTDLPLTTLYWRVAGMDAGSLLGPYSAPGSFTKVWGAAPTIVAPDDLGTFQFPTQPVLFRWNPLDGAKSYRLEIDDQDDFLGASFFITPNTSLTLTEPQTAGQTFYWRLQATSPDGQVSDWTATRSYTYEWPAVPVLLSPANSIFNPIEDVDLAWSPVLGAATYQVQISPNADWENNKAVDVIVKGTRYSPPTGLNTGSFFWRVRARDARALPNNGGWSEEWQFLRRWPDLPTLLTPIDGNAFVTTPTFSWTPIDHAAFYELQAGTDINFSPGTFSNCFTNHTAFTPYRAAQTSESTPGGCGIAGLDPGTTYYWRVRGVDSPSKIDNSENVDGEWSNVFSFTFKPSIPDLVAPADGATVSTPVLEWDPVPGIGEYVVTIKKETGTTALTIETSSLSYTPVVTLDPADGPYSWYVQTLDAEGEAGLIPHPSTWGSFSLVAPATTVAAPDPITPADAASSTRMPSMTWADVTDAEYYRVLYTIAGSGVESYLSGSTKLHYAGYTHPTLLPPGTYGWRVEAYGENDVKLVPDGMEQTFVIANLQVATYVGPEKCTPSVATCDPIADTPTLTWNHVQNAGGYIVYRAVDASFTNIKSRYTTIYNTLTPRESYLDNQAGQAYFWFVRPCNQGGTSPCGAFDSSVYGNAFAFQKRSAPIEPQLPLPDVAGTADDVADQVTFTWRDFLATNGDLADPVTQEAKQYKIEVSKVADFASVFDTKLVDQLTYTPYDKTYPDGPLYWRVQAIDGSNNSLTKSAARLVKKSSPAPVTTFPANAATVTGVPYFQWDPQAFAARYAIEVYQNGDTNFSIGNRVLNTVTKFTAWSPTGSLAAGTYAWRVQRLDADGNPGPWSAAKTFVLQPLAPTLVAPANNAIFQDNNIVFTWTAVPGAVQYRWEASTTCTFASITASAVTVMTSWAPSSALPDGTFCWRVRVLDARPQVVATSSTRLFFKDTVKPTVTAKTPTTNASILGPFTVTFSEPVKNVSTTTFKVVIAGTTTAVAGTVSPAATTLTSTASFTPLTPLLPGQSYAVSLTSGIVDGRGLALVPMSWTVRTALVVETDSRALLQLWDRDTSTSANGGGYDSSRIIGNRSLFTFKGTNIALIGQKAPDAGLAEVWLDGVKQTTVNSYNSTTLWQQTLWSKAGLPDVTHTIDVRVLGTKSASSTNTWFYIDGFRIGTTVYQENHGAVRDLFRVIATTSAYGGSYATASHTPSTDVTPPYYQLSFKGTGVAVYATKTPASGKAGIYVDGVLKATVDLYSATAAYKVKVFDSGTLTSATHAIVVKILGTKATASAGTDVGVDQILIR